MADLKPLHSPARLPTGGSPSAPDVSLPMAEPALSQTNSDSKRGVSGAAAHGESADAHPTKPRLLEYGCMGLIAEMVLWTVTLVAIGMSGSEPWGFIIGLCAAALAIGMMLRRWSSHSRRPENSERRGGEMFERESGNSGSED